MCKSKCCWNLEEELVSYFSVRKENPRKFEDNSNKIAFWFLLISTTYRKDLILEKDLGRASQWQVIFHCIYRSSTFFIDTTRLSSWITYYSYFCYLVTLVGWEVDNISLVCTVFLFPLAYSYFSSVNIEFYPFLWVSLD